MIHLTHEGPEPTPEEPKTIDVEIVVDGVKYAGTLTEKE